MKLTVHTFDLPLQHTFRISREAIQVQPTVIVELSESGHQGFGEATTNAYYGVTRAKLVEDIESVRLVMEQATDSDPHHHWPVLAERLSHNPFALCAIDQALHDLHGKLVGQPLYQLWGGAERPRPVSNYTIGIDTIERMIEKLLEKPDWPIYKIKLGTDNDLEIIRRLREHTDAIFRVDANCGWTVQQALHHAETLALWNVEFIEQPLPAGDWAGQKELFRHSPLPIVADESCQIPADVACCHGFFHGINIKLVKCGGLTPAREMIRDARAWGMRVMVGCMTESTVGISAIAQLLPWLDYVDMDGATLLARDIATGVVVDRGVCHYGELAGTGARLNRAEGV